MRRPRQGVHEDFVRNRSKFRSWSEFHVSISYVEPAHVAPHSGETDKGAVNVEKTRSGDRGRGHAERGLGLGVK